MTYQFETLKQELECWCKSPGITCEEFLARAILTHQALIEVINRELQTRKHLRWWNKKRHLGAPGLLGMSNLVLEAWRGWAFRMIAAAGRLQNNWEDSAQDRNAWLGSLTFARDYLGNNINRLDIPTRHPFLAIKKMISDVVVRLKTKKSTKGYVIGSEYDYGSFPMQDATANVEVRLFATEDGAVTLSENNSYKCLVCRDQKTTDAGPCALCNSKEFYQQAKEAKEATKET